MTVIDGRWLHGDLDVSADVCVVGTGAGGGPVAKELAEAGMRVVSIEEGDWFAPEELTARPRDMLMRLYRDAGQFTTLGAPPILLPLGKAVGGSTLVNSGTCFRAPDHLLASWVTDLGLDGLGPAELAPLYEHVERELRVAVVSPALAGRNAAVARRGAEALGWSGGYLRRNAHGCRGSGVCAFGCPSGAKQHSGVSWMPRAWEAGARTYSGTRALRVEIRGGRARGVEARTAGGCRLRVRAGRVVVAAGTVHTPLLLAASGVGAGSGQLGRNLSIHPATAAWALLDEEVDMGRGVPQSYFVDEFASDGIMLEGIAGPPDYLAMGIPFAGARHRELMLRYRHVAQFGLMVSDVSRGRVLVGRAARAGGRPIVRYDLHAADAGRVQRGLEHIAEMFGAAGARTVITPVARARELPEGDPAPLRRLTLRPGELKLMAFHPLGTARAHGDPSEGVLDADLAVRGVEGLHVADGSAVPTALGVNPQLTIMALAVRLARHLMA